MACLESDVQFESESENEDARSQESELEFKECETDTGSCLTKGVLTKSLKKRMASPLEKTNVKRFTPPPTPKSVKQKAPKKTTLKVKSNMSFSDMKLMTFAEPSFITGVGPYLSTIMQPMIQGAIECAVKTTVETVNSSVVDKVIESNKDLQLSNSKLQSMVEKQQSIIDNQAKLLNSHEDRIMSMEGKIDELTKEMSTLKMEMSNLEQYGRRNSLRFSNMKVKQTDFSTENEFKKHMVTFINGKVLNKEQSGISTNDIDRCHAVGMSESPQVLVKFRNYETKRLVYASKKNLKNNPRKVFVTEDLTRFNQSLVKTLITLKKAKTISSFWTINGSIFLKKPGFDNIVMIQKSEDFTRLGLL